MLKLNDSIAVRRTLFALNFLFVGFAIGTELNAGQIEASQEYLGCIDEA